jgi:hypothetical protein
LNNRIRIERNRVDSAFNEKLGEFRVIRRRLSADADFLAVAFCSLNRQCDYFFDRAVVFIKFDARPFPNSGLNPDFLF